MRGRREPQVSMLAFIDLETRVPAGHPLRTIKGLADRALAQLSPEFDRMYAQIGRPSIPPERLLKASLLISLYSVRAWDGGPGGPAWSPGGLKIAFVRAGEIYLMNANGSAQTRLTHNQAVDYSPVWSPDGRSIAFESRRDGNWEIYAMRTDGSSQTNLTNNGADDGLPEWVSRRDPDRVHSRRRRLRHVRRWKASEAAHRGLRLRLLLRLVP